MSNENIQTITPTAILRQMEAKLKDMVMTGFNVDIYNRTEEETMDLITGTDGQLTFEEGIKEGTNNVLAEIAHILGIDLPVPFQDPTESPIDDFDNAEIDDPDELEDDEVEKGV